MLQAIHLALWHRVAKRPTNASCGSWSLRNKATASSPNGGMGQHSTLSERGLISKLMENPGKIRAKSGRCQFWWKSECLNHKTSPNSMHFGESSFVRMWPAWLKVVLSDSFTIPRFVGQYRSEISHAVACNHLTHECFSLWGIQWHIT